MVFQNKSVSWKSHRGPAQGGACQRLQRVLWGRSGLPPHSQVSRLVTKRVPRGVASVGGLAMGTLTFKGAGVVLGVP